MRTDEVCNEGPRPDIPATAEEQGGVTELLFATIMSTHGSTGVGGGRRWHVTTR
jgi:hypothetical protein